MTKNIKSIVSIFLIFSFGCEPTEKISAESAKNDTITLLKELKIEYKGVHCIVNNYRFATCEISPVKGELLKSTCDYHNCILKEKGALRIKFGIAK